MNKSNILRILYLIRGRVYNSIIDDENLDVNIYQAYIDATGKKFSEISKDIPKIKYFIKPSLFHEKMDSIKSLALINDLIDLYEGYYQLGLKQRIKNMFNYIKNSF